MTATRPDDGETHLLAVAIPVYRGSQTLEAVVGELVAMDGIRVTNDGHRFRISEILLVDDCGPDGSDDVIRTLDERHEIVRPIWLSRNFGQHAATLAGMSSAAAEWIVTMDEDGQHDPAAIPNMLDTAMAERAAVVYAEPTNTPSHGWLRNLGSSAAKVIFTRVLSSGSQPRFYSYRLVLGEVARSVAAYGGEGVYLDVALGWITQRFATCPWPLRDEGERRSGYRFRSLASHFWRLVLSSGTRPLRFVSLIGVVFAFVGVVASAIVIVGRVSGRIEVEGWASLSIIFLIGFGLVLFSLGLVAEYVGVAVRMAFGKPSFLILGDPMNGPLGRRPSVEDDSTN